MDVLRNLFGNVSATVLRLALVAGTLALVYVFAIRPVLDTTEEISSQAISSQNQISTSIRESVQQQIAQTNRQIQQSIDQSRQQLQNPPPTQRQITRVVHGLTPGEARRLNRCVQRAGANLGAFNRCFDRFERRAKRRAAR
jgi:hypothetical protein